MIAPAHRDDDTAVTACLRSRPPRRMGRRDLSAPNQIRPASSPRYTDPNNSPIAVNASASAAVGCIRVRIRTPAGAPPPPDQPIRRSDRTLIHAPHPGSHHRHQHRSPHRHRSLARSINHFRSLSGEQLATPRSTNPRPHPSPVTSRWRKSVQSAVAESHHLALVTSVVDNRPSVAGLRRKHEGRHSRGSRRRRIVQQAPMGQARTSGASCA